MINSTYLYLFISILLVFSIVILFFNFKPNKSLISNKILLKHLLENLDLELPDELKQLENSTTDPQKFS